MVNTKSFVISSLLIGLFAIALVSFGVKIAENNNANQTILDNEAISSGYTSINSSLAKSQTDFENQSGTFFSEAPIIGEIGIILTSIVNVGKVITGTARGIYDLTIGMIFSTFGINNIVLTVITSIILITIVLIVWRTYRSGT